MATAIRKNGLRLTRKEGEVIMIGDKITVEVVFARAGRARVRVVAPPDVRIDRKEVAEKRAAENQIECVFPAAVDSYVREEQETTAIIRKDGQSLEPEVQQ